MLPLSNDMVMKKQLFENPAAVYANNEMLKEKKLHQRPR
jgi:hypothetical protein